jgi:hypothetical protein
VQRARPALVVLAEAQPTLEELHEARAVLSRRGLQVTGLLPPRALLVHTDRETAQRLTKDRRVEAVHFDSVSLGEREHGAAPHARVLRVWNQLRQREETEQRSGRTSQLDCTAPLAPLGADADRWGAHERTQQDRSYRERWAQRGAAIRNLAHERQGLATPAPQRVQQGGNPLAALTPQPASFNDTSLYMAGDIAVGVFYVASTFGPWTQPMMDAFTADIIAGLNQFPLDEPNAQLTFTYVIEGAVPLPADWRQYANDLRNSFDTDWGFMMQVENSSTTSYARLFGPETVLHVDNDEAVIRHETGHIFGATDQYPAGTTPTFLAGYLAVVNANSMRNNGQGFFAGQGEAVDDFMISPSSNEIFAYSRGQLGWRDEDGDGIPDPVDTFAETTLEAPVGSTQLTFSGHACERPLPNAYWLPIYGDVSINTVSNVSYRMNGLTWVDADPVDGDFDGQVEAFSFVTPELPDGSYIIETRATNSQGNVESVYPQRKVVVAGSTVTNLAPFADFSVSPEGGSTGTLFTFDAGTSSDLEDATPALEVRWDFDDDGSWDTPWSTDHTVDFSFPSPKVQTVVMEVRDSALATQTASLDLRISFFDQPPTAFFTVSPESQHALPDVSEPYFEVTLNASGSSDPESATLVRWDFEDDGVWDTPFSAFPGIVHQYPLEIGPPNVAQFDMGIYGAKAVDVAGNLAVVAGQTASGLHVVDVTDPANPVVLGSDSSSCCGWDVALEGNLVYVADGAAGLQIIDITDPANPTPIGNYDTPGAAFGVDIKGSYAFVADDGPGLVIIDVSDPTSPTFVSTLDPAGMELGVCVDGNYAYVAAGSFGLYIIDVSDPVNPSLVGNFVGNVNDVEVESGIAYCAASYQGLRMVDVSNPAAPVLLGEFDFETEAMAVAVSGGNAYVTDDEFNIEVFDVSTPSSPVKTGRSYVFEGRDAVTAGDLLLLASKTGLELVDLAGTPVFFPRTLSERIRLQVMDAANGTTDEAVRNVWAVTYNTSPTVSDFDWAWSADVLAPSVLSTFVIETLSDILVSGSTAYVGRGAFGVSVLDVSDPSAPTELGTFAVSSAAQDLAVDGSLLFVANAWDGLSIMDVSNPAAATEVGSYTTSSLASSVEVVGGTAYVGGLFGFLTLDVTDPANPTLLGTEASITYPLDIEIVGGRAYVASSAAGLRILDISDPANPTLLGSFDTAAAYSVTADGDLVYLTAGAFGLSIFDASDPTSPVLLGTLDTPDLAFEAVIDGSYAYVADFDGGVQIVDVSLPRAPISAGSLTLSGNVNRLTQQAGLIYAADQDIGLTILETAEAQEHMWDLTSFTAPDFAKTWDGHIQFRVDMGSDGTWDTAFTDHDELARALYITEDSEDPISVTCEVRDRFGAVVQIERSFVIRRVTRGEMFDTTR